MTAFMRILVSSKDTLKKIMVRGEFDEYPDEVNMHCTARMAEMLDEYSKELQSKFHKEITADKFLMDEIRVLLETRGIGLPNFLPKSAFLTLLQKNVKEVSETPFVFVEKVWKYVEEVFVCVLKQHSENYPQLQSSTKRAAQNLMSLIKNKSADRVKEIVEMEKVVDYTCNPDYMSTLNSLMGHQENFTKVLNDMSESKIGLPIFGDIEVGHLREYPSVVVQQAFDMKMRCTAYWKIVLLRLVDSLALHLVFSVHNLVSRDMEVEIVKDLMNPHNGGVERMLEESPKVTIRREKLNRSIKLLKVSKEEVSKIMDRISADGGPAQV
ncbi:hypothetical protein GIB67_020591 [Kingdonia uniflora]|uniref:GED domain-containing protein n=1 Tax=Kingdonia uniflora TaxID=39325 RepID=A0A7J7L1S8_9MAGN|nr:hypothetical protein GIB67_031105 [Kingdonia uniflora]KAF6136530.1 hypothetical protein GIB67_031107 [Kingdonia uniflora]KAF6138831.1 hypothetical protein GIB67_017248 [Kingdonia uniflora]KAF6157284.1 hypothetical protein GIB67_022891 [Kingdonia uniflora]KAF6157285.1 hypothetical protein GIB67_022892 [Kingdonia uniflora]